MLTGMPSEADIIKGIEGFGSDIGWLKSHKIELRKDYKNQFVAVLNKEVIASATDLKKLITQLKKDKIDTSNVAIEFITEKPIRLLLRKGCY